MDVKGTLPRESAACAHASLRGAIRVVSLKPPEQFKVENISEAAYAVCSRGKGVLNLTSAPQSFSIGGIRAGADARLFLIAGPCVIESEAHATSMAGRLASIASDLGVPLIFKASYDKANRSSVSSYRGPGLQEGLRILANIKKSTGLPILTDVHDVSQVGPVAEVCDVLQIPAFLSARPTARSGRPLGARGQHQEGPVPLAAGDRQCGREGSEHGKQEDHSHRTRRIVWLSEPCGRYALLPIMRKFGYPVVFDVTHSMQLPGGEGKSSGGQPEFIEPLARAGTAAGVDGIFLEVHDNPAKALSDGTNALPLDRFRPLVEKLLRLSDSRSRMGSAAQEVAPAGNGRKEAR